MPREGSGVEQPGARERGAERKRQPPQRGDRRPGYKERAEDPEELKQALTHLNELLEFREDFGVTEKEEAQLRLCFTSPDASAQGRIEALARIDMMGLILEVENRRHEIEEWWSGLSDQERGAIDEPPDHMDWDWIKTVRGVFGKMKSLERDARKGPDKGGGRSGAGPSKEQLKKRKDKSEHDQEVREGMKGTGEGGDSKQVTDPKGKKGRKQARQTAQKKKKGKK